MQITLNQDEIEEAIEAYVRGQISIALNQEVTIDLKAGRGDNGFSAVLDIRTRRVKPDPTPALPNTVTRGPLISTGEPKEPEPEVQETETPTKTPETIPETSTESTQPAEEVKPTRKNSIFNFKKPEDGSDVAAQ